MLLRASRKRPETCTSFPFSFPPPADPSVHRVFRGVRAGLENRYGLSVHRGFESPPLRLFADPKTHSGSARVKPGQRGPRVERSPPTSVGHKIDISPQIGTRRAGPGQREPTRGPTLGPSIPSEARSVSRRLRGVRVDRSRGLRTRHMTLNTRIRWPSETNSRTCSAAKRGSVAQRPEELPAH
jgi:hypothetical protein